jgi:hypothetical protein
MKDRQLSLADVLTLIAGQLDYRGVGGKRAEHIFLTRQEALVLMKLQKDWKPLED